MKDGQLFDAEGKLIGTAEITYPDGGEYRVENGNLLDAEGNMVKLGFELTLE